MGSRFIGIAMVFPPDLAQQVKQILNFEAECPAPMAHQCYGLGRWLRRDLGLPDIVPLHIHMDHGVRISSAITNCDLLSQAPIFFTSAAQKNEYYRQTGKRSYVCGSPFVAYRHLNHIEKSPSAKGIVAFPVHSTHLIDVVIDWEQYAEDLLNLPPEFQPITVCLYWKDLLAERHTPFLKRGIAVTTAGHIADPDFAVTFYDILRQHCYCTSNMAGSYTFYAIEMGIPFFLHGEPPLFNNHGHDHNRPLGTYTLENLSDEQEKHDWLAFQNLFELNIKQDIVISDQIRALCLNKLGINQTDSPTTLRRVIYSVWAKQMAMRPIQKTKHAIRKILTKAQSATAFINEALTGNIRQLEGVIIPTSEVISPIIRKAILSGDYEFGEITLLKKYLSSQDIVMEIGGGLGFLSAYCAKKIGSDRVFTYEANPALEDVIQVLHAKNQVTPKVEISMVLNTDNPEKLEKFYVTQDFWSSSPIFPIHEPLDQVLDIPIKSFKQELSIKQPTFLVVDIEGGEYDLFQQATLDTVRKLIIEVHAVLGKEKQLILKNILTNLGFQLIDSIPNCNDEIWYLQRSSF